MNLKSYIRPYIKTVAIIFFYKDEYEIKMDFTHMNNLLIQTKFGG